MFRLEQVDGYNKEKWLFFKAIYKKYHVKKSHFLDLILCARDAFEPQEWVDVIFKVMKDDSEVENAVVERVLADMDDYDIAQLYNERGLNQR